MYAERVVLVLSCRIIIVIVIVFHKEDFEMQAKTRSTEIIDLEPAEGEKVKTWFIRIVKQMQPRDMVEFTGCDAGNLRSYLSNYRSTFGGKFRTQMVPGIGVEGVRVIKDR